MRARGADRRFTRVKKSFIDRTQHRSAAAAPDSRDRGSAFDSDRAHGRVIRRASVSVGCVRTAIEHRECGRLRTVSPAHNASYALELEYESRVCLCTRASSFVATYITQPHHTTPHATDHTALGTLAVNASVVHLPRRRRTRASSASFVVVAPSLIRASASITQSNVNNNKVINVIIINSNIITQLPASIIVRPPFVAELSAALDHDAQTLSAAADRCRQAAANLPQGRWR